MSLIPYYIIGGIFGLLASAVLTVPFEIGYRRERHALERIDEID